MSVPPPPSQGLDTNLYKHVAMDFRQCVLRKPTAEMQTITILGYYVLHLQRNRTFSFNYNSSNKKQILNSYEDSYNFTGFRSK